MMQELGLDFAEFRKTFVKDTGHPFMLIKVPTSATVAWEEILGVSARRCYLSDTKLSDNINRTNRSPSEIIKANIPDVGSVKAGDFGEILTALFLASEAYPNNVRDPKKWRLKEGRNKPAPHSDVVQFILPEWPNSSSNDKVICAEVKTKSTNNDSKPIASAIEDSQKDSKGRLTKTLMWLRERALGEDLGTVDLDQIERFIKAIDHPQASYDFRAVAVICSSLLDSELNTADLSLQEECTLVVISVAELKKNYESLYSAIMDSTE
ncbi:Hachiman antiphage defense system protein HamA [Actinopolyspora sp. H202]|uniref:Hachiman antiphage defense system protein HamA n=1 Tax=Actinopolyspora sp. H202 TaxID=1500456 RepID=UPI003EE6C556